MIDGNLIGTFQTQTTKKNSIGEGVLVWSDVIQKKGFLDYVTGDVNFEMNAKIQESTHTFSFVIGLIVLPWKLHQRMQESSLMV